jgi:CRP-like cAMP-binding protein
MSSPSAALSPFGVKTPGFTSADLPPEARAFLQAHGTIRRYSHGERIPEAPVDGTGMWMLAGRLICMGMQPDGTVQHVGWITADNLFGVNRLLLETPARLTLQVDSEFVQMLHFPRDVLLTMMRTVPLAGLGICVGLSRRLQQQYDTIDVLGSRTLADKLRAVLLWWSQHYGIPARDGSVELWVVQGDIADAVGASRQRVHLELQSLKCQGEIDLAYRKVILRPVFFQDSGGAPARN